MKKVSKKIGAAVLAAVLCFSLSACGGQEKDITVDIRTLADDLLNNISYEGKPEEIENMEFYYYPSEINELAADQVIYIDMTTAEEVTVIEGKDADSTQKIAEIAQQHLVDVKESNEDYFPATIEKLDNAVVQSGGKYVVVCVSNDSSAAQEIIDGYLK